MTRLIHTLLFALLLALSVTPVMAGDNPSVDQQLDDLTLMCDHSAKARSDRHAQKSLHDRLGGYEAIHELTREIVRLHSINPEIKHTLDHVDHAQLAKHVADFVAAGTGGTTAYTGRSMPDAHAHLALTNAHFLSAGGDVAKAMQTLGHGQDEIDEILCILVSLKDQVVFN